MANRVDEVHDETNGARVIDQPHFKNIRDALSAHSEEDRVDLLKERGIELYRANYYSTGTVIEFVREQLPSRLWRVDVFLNLAFQRLHTNLSGESEGYQEFACNELLEAAQEDLSIAHKSVQRP